MPLYSLKIIDKSGKLQEYNKEYTDIGTLKNDVRLNGHLLVEFKEKKKRENPLAGVFNRLRVQLQSRTISDEDVYNIFYEVGIILKAGVPVMRALRMIIDETPKDVLKGLLEDIFFHLKEGGNFSDILEKKTGYYNFTPYVPIIRRGEKTGSLGESFLNIAHSIEKQMQIKGEITNALIYPLILIGTGLVAVYVMLVYVIPRFETIVESFDVVLPTHTQILFALSIFLNNNQDLVIIGGIVLLLVLLILGRNPKFKEFSHRIVNAIPIVRGIKFSSENLKFLSTLSNLLTGGVPILSAIGLAAESFTAPKVRDKLKHVSLSLRKGDSLATALKEADIFPEIVPNMIRVGEESGTLPEVLNELHNFMSQRFLKKTKKYMNLLEPMVIIFIALFIGLLIMSIIPIIMNISDVDI
ncbi:MAG: type II secretion system F family protein [bacterium]|nr:type II secretion system F family protein [bacterium]